MLLEECNLHELANLQDIDTIKTDMYGFIIYTPCMHTS